MQSPFSGFVSSPLLLILTATMLGGIGQGVIQAGMKQVGQLTVFGPSVLKAFSNPFVILGFLAYAVSSVLYLVVVSRKGISYAYPFVAANQLIVLFMARFIFNDPIPFLRYMGVFVICMGVIMVAISGRQP